MKPTPAILILFLSLNCNAQILLKGYKCRFLEGQWPYTMAEMYKGNDTFRFTLYSRDIGGELIGDEDNPKNSLVVGLRLCFSKNEHYFKTKDSLYVSTGKYTDNLFYYKVYIPANEVSLSLRSNKNDADFSDKSKWLLSQIRRNKGNDMYFQNEKHQICQNPDNPKE